jgi:ABC-type branched-subunit amino acid transport system substrate-binding protein
MNRQHFGAMSVGLAIALTAGACSSRNQTTSVRASVPSQAASTAHLLDAYPLVTQQVTSPGDFGSLRAVCGPGNAHGATAPGVTDKTIDVGTMSDPGSTALPGLDQELFDNATAFTKWCNDAGGIAGRKITLHLRDAKTYSVAAQTMNACAQDFSEAGGGTELDDAGVDIRVKCGLPDLPAFTVSVKAANAPLEVEATPLPTEQEQVSMFRGAQQMFPGITRVGFVGTNLPGAITDMARESEGAGSLGFKTVFNEAYSAQGIDNPGSYVQRMKAANVEALMVIGDGSALASLERAMQTADWYPKAIVELDNVYNPSFIANGASAIKNTWVSVQYFPFELASQNVVTKQYMDILAAEDPGAKVTTVGLQGWDAWLLFATAARDCGSDLTRACLLTNAASHPDWTGGGLKSTTNTATTNRQMPDCYMMLEATPDGFVPDPAFLPPTNGSFDCDPANVVSLRGDYSKS